MAETETLPESTDIIDASEIARMRLDTVCERAHLSEDQQEIVLNLVRDLTKKMARQLGDTGLASTSIADVAIMLRSMRELGDDIEASHLERMLVTAIVGAIAVEFRKRGYSVTNHYGVVVSLV